MKDYALLFVSGILHEGLRSAICFRRTSWRTSLCYLFQAYFMKDYTLVCVSGILHEGLHSALCFRRTSWTTTLCSVFQAYFMKDYTLSILVLAQTVEAGMKADNTHTNTGNTHTNTGNTHINTSNTHTNTGYSQWTIIDLHFIWHIKVLLWLNNYLLSPAYEIGRGILKWRCPSVRPSVRHLRFLSN